MTDTAVFRRLDLFAGLDEGALRRAVGELDAVVVPAGEEFDIAASGAVCGVVGGGRLALAFIAEEDRERTIGMLEEGDVIVRPTDGWAAVGPRVRCFAIEDALMHLVDRARLEAWMHDPALAANLVRVLSAQIADRELAVAIALEPRVERRLLLKLRQLAERWGRVTPDGIRLDLRLTHQELANMVGAVRESVTIALGRLASAGEIEVRNRTLLIRRLDDDRGRRRPRGRRAVILRPRGPFSLRQSIVGRAGGTLRLRGGELEMTVRPDGAPGLARVVQLSDGTLRCQVAEGDPDAVAAEVRRRLSLDADTSEFRERFRDDPLIGEGLRRRPGFRPVARGTVAQAAVAAVAGQLVTWAEAAAVEARVVAAAAPRRAGLRLPPTRAELAALSPAELAARGLSPGRALTLARLLRTLDPEALRGHESRAVVARLTRERGLGPWSAGVVGLLGLGRLDVGLVGDLGLIRLATRLNGRPAGVADTAALLAPYGEWAGIASLHLLAHPWAVAPVRRGGRATRRTTPAGPRATPGAAAPPPRTSPRPSPG